MTVAHYDLTATDEAGNIIAGASVEVRLEIPGAPLATLYSDRAGTTTIANPTTTDSHGYAEFYCVGGAYKITVTSGSDSKRRRYVGIGLAQETDAPAEGLVQRVVTAAGTAAVTAEDADIILINKTVAAATRVVLPGSDDAVKPVRIVDGKLDADTNNITIVPERPFTVTMAVASPGVVTLAAHGRAANDPVSFETTGALLTGLVADTQYYVKTVLSVNTFSISETPGGAAIAFTGSQSGVHTMATDTLMGAASYLIDGKGGSYKFTPRDDAKGWF